MTTDRAARCSLHPPRCHKRSRATALRLASAASPEQLGKHLAEKVQWQAPKPGASLPTTADVTQLRSFAAGYAQHVQNNKVNPSKDLQNLSAELLGVVL